MKNKKTILNQRGESCIGKVCVVVRPIEYGQGRVKTPDNVFWSVLGDDCCLGTKVQVTGLSVSDPMTLEVKELF